VHTIFFVLLAFIAGCGGNRKSALTEEEIRQKTYAPLPTQPDEIVISGETIACEDVTVSLPEEDTAGPSIKDRLAARAKEVSLEQFLVEARPVIQQRLNRNIVTRIVLAKRARRELGDKADDALNKMVEKDFRRLIIEDYGGNGAEMDAALQRRGLSRATYLERRKRDFLAQYVIDSKFRRNRPVTYGEIAAHYEKVKDQEFLREGVLQLRLIDIEVAKVKLADPNEDPVQAARRVAGDLRKRIDAGEDFAELAKQYSDDPRGRTGGLLRPRNPDALESPYDVLAAQAKEMKRGEVAGPVEAPDRFFVMKVEDKQDQGYQPLAEVQDRVREEILRERRRVALEELEAEIAQEASVADTTQFVDYCLERLYKLAH
jgi:parvulin-like peptidyl-prolyl isomerase